jgi:hypothetical protein
MIFPDLKLICQGYSNRMTFQDLINNKQVVERDPEFSATYNNIIHLYDCEVVLPSKGLEKVIRYIQLHADTYQYEKLIFIISTKSHAIRGLLSQPKIAKFTNMRMELCCNPTQAANILGLQEHAEFLEDTFKVISKAD